MRQIADSKKVGFAPDQVATDASPWDSVQTPSDLRPWLQDVF